ncbi:MAG: ATP-binding protein [Lachnospiraceae bacterium]|nr:ATP-binding protein [Lachnospiraceae bacterium]
MEKKFSYGRNVSALFVGAPGTGKTMAVHVLSSMLNLPLYKIDLSQVVDKYIGETEKKLEEIFNLAEKSNTILFFDEADSIFGKRSEVNDSKDRYANTEVSYILQRIEQYDGIVILASNYKKNIDEAFMRRMRYLVEFPIPDVETRKEIWRSSFTEQVPKEELDFDFLAENFELSGGIIKNIVLNAIFSAAQQGKEVEMIHILESLKNEKAKIGKPMIKKDFAKYEYLFD